MDLETQLSYSGPTLPESGKPHTVHTWSTDEGFIAAVKLPRSGDPVLSASRPYRIGQLTQHSSTQASAEQLHSITYMLVRIIQNTFKHPVLKLSNPQHGTVDHPVVTVSHDHGPAWDTRSALQLPAARNRS